MPLGIDWHRFGVQLRAARKARSVTLRDAAERLGCSMPTVHQLELYGKPVGASLYLQACLTFGVDPWDCFFPEGTVRGNDKPEARTITANSQ